MNPEEPYEHKEGENNLNTNYIKLNKKGENNPNTGNNLNCNNLVLRENKEIKGILKNKNSNTGGNQGRDNSVFGENIIGKESSKEEGNGPKRQNNTNKENNLNYDNLASVEENTILEAIRCNNQKNIIPEAIGIDIGK